MIPEWEAALAQAARCVAPGGRLEVVDFGQQERLPALWRRALFGWLARFHVSPRRELSQAIERLARESGSEPRIHILYRGYAVRGGLVRA
jgi:S-adenosylmethionine-diacylgycerolhomoserine-N-methlytransferase